jgi:hypothetical protein
VTDNGNWSLTVSGMYTAIFAVSRLDTHARVIR